MHLIASSLSSPRKTACCEPLGCREGCLSGRRSPLGRGDPGLTRCAMGVGDDDASGSSERTRLEVFTGADPTLYRMWKRRAQLMLASLPSTISEKKYGPKLMSFVSGEAEHLLDHIEVSKLCEEGGDRLIFAALDEKYGPRQIDLLQDSLRTYFYDLTIKQNESYRQFSARYATAQRRLEEQKVNLPNVVLGFMYLKKLRMDSHSESMVLTASAGKLEIKEIMQAVNSIFPDGKGGASKPEKQREIFQAEDQKPTQDESDGSEDMQRALEVVAEDIQSRDEWDEEDVLDAFETYTDIRKKMKEHKTSRGFYPRPAPGKNKQETWRLSGSIKGRIEQLKARTQCNVCKRTGHWKRECPMRSNASSSNNTEKNKEVMLVEGNEKVQELWEIFMNEDSATKDMAWQHSLANDVLNSGNSDTHSTGNQQRLHGSSSSSTRSTERRQASEVFQEQGQLRVEDFEDPVLTKCGVPDTACRKTLVGQTVLANIEKHLKDQGLRVQRAKTVCEFRFGNNGILSSEEVALIPACIHGKRFIVKAAVLPAEGSSTPLLLSKKFLRQLGSVIDLSSDMVRFNKLGCEVKLQETQKGHYAIPLFQFKHVDAFAAEDRQKKKKTESQKQYDITQLEKVKDSPEALGSKLVLGPFDPEQETLIGHLSDHDQSPSNVLQQPSKQQRIHAEGHLGDAQGLGAEGRVGSGDHTEHRLFSRLRDGHGGEPNLRRVPDQCWQTSQKQELAVADLHHGQKLRGLGETTHNLTKPCRDEEAASVHSICRQSKGKENQRECSDSTKEDPYERGSQPREDSHQSSRGRDGVGSLGECEHHGERESPGIMDEDGNQHTAQETPRGQAVHLPDRQHEGRNSVPSEFQVGSDEHVMSKKVRKQLTKNIQFLNAVQENTVNETDRSFKGDVYTVDLRWQGDVWEVFSVPRIGTVAQAQGLKKVKSFDQNHGGWNFLDAKDRKRCLEEIARDQPQHVHVCPPCGPFSVLQNINAGKREPGQVSREWVEAMVLLEFAIQIYEVQHQNNRGFSFEHPWGAKSWNVECVERLRNKPQVYLADFDQCMYGSKEPISNHAYRKRTGMLTNNEYMMGLLQKKCDQNHVHQRLEGKIKVGGHWCNRTMCAQVYPRGLVDAMVKGIRKKIRRKEMDVLAVEKLSGKHEGLQELVHRCHVNLGHPSRERFLHMLKSAGASEEAIKVAKEHKCSVCIANKSPGHHPVVNTHKNPSFNTMVSMDTFEVSLDQAKKIKMLNICCEGTGLQMVVPLWKGALAKNVREAYRKYWVRWAGKPPKIKTDGGREIDGEFQEGCDKDQTYVTKSAAESPWQQGFCERQGGLWKDVYYKAKEESQPRTKEEFNELFDQVTESKNSVVRRHGFSPYQHVFGSDLKVPPGLLDQGMSEYVRSGILQGVESHVRAQEIRQAARRAMIGMDDIENVRRAVQRQSRSR